jgi:membrane-bound serine protease (ClpP class)
LIIPIEGAISEITHDSIERRLERVEAEDIPLVIFEMDTPGGALGPTLEICNMIRDLRDENVATYAWINNDAYSAGTIIALATDGIVMARNATIGDCEPIMITPAGVSAIPEDIKPKATSPLLAELRQSARDGGYPLDMVLALIRPKMQIFWVENTETAERRFVDTHGRNELFGLSDLDDDADDDDDDADDEKDRKSRKKRQSTVEPISDSRSITSWRYVTEAPELGKIDQPIVPDDELLTMRTAWATAYGFSKATLNDLDAVRGYFNVSGAIDKQENTWIESLVEWLASPTVRSVLFLLMMLGAYMEFQTPGFGLPGAVALVALVLFLGAPYMAGFTVTWEIVAIVLGVALLTIEAFVIPGFGVAGIAGIILLMIGLAASFVPAEPTFDKDWFRLPSLPMTYDYLKNGLISMAVGLTGSIVGMVLIAKYMPKVPVVGRVIAPNPDHDALQIDDPYGGMARVGDRGQAESLLRPAGKARFGHLLVDVVSEGEYIQKGVQVEVVERHGNRVVVRRVD